MIGINYAEIGAINGLDIRDPTRDARILDFTFSVPDNVFIDPKTGIDRWLVREAMKDRLPDAVRLNNKRGRQSADIVPLLRSNTLEVEETLIELERGLAAEFVDVEYMRQIWRMAQSSDTHEARKYATTILLRGIMAGLFVNSFYD